jgi:KDO2-lipid IV(A) lauroyltransferase
MAKSRFRIADYSVYVGLRTLICVVQALPFDLARSFAAGLAWVVYRVDKRHRRVAINNLRHAFPDEYDEAGLDLLVRRVFRHFCTLAVEIMHLPRCFHAHNWHRFVELPQGDILLRQMLSGRSIMFVTGHFGNWELGGFMLGALGFRTAAIARTLDNPWIDHLLRVKFREKTGQQILSKDGDFERIQVVLATGGALATLADQDAGQRGLFVSFFNRPASTHKAVALFSLQHQAPLVVIGTARLAEPMHYGVLVEDVIFPEDYEGQSDAVRNITQRYTAALERLVRRYPEQYFWLHRRWKHQPALKARKKAA